MTEVAGRAATAARILIAGCGPVGATLALMLAQRGVAVTVVDKAAEPYPLPRAIALDSDAFRILQGAGISSDDYPSVPVPRVRLISPWFGRIGDAATDHLRDTHPAQSTFHQPALEEALRARLRALPELVDLRLGTELLEYQDTGLAISARLADAAGAYQAEFAYLVGCDGAHSLVRKIAGIGFDGRSYQNDWLIIDAENASGGIDHVEFLCNPARPTPHMLAPGGRQRWEFMLRPGETREEMETDAAIDRLLAPWGGLQAIRIHRRAVYRFHARTAETFRKGRVMIAGDAAHVTPRFVGQGLVAGLRDCENLAWKLTAVVQGGAGDHILGSYDSERRPHARAMIAFARQIGVLIAPDNRVSGFLLHGIVRLLRLAPPARHFLDSMGMRPASRFQRGLFLRGQRRGRIRSGARMPQIWLQGPKGDRLRSDDVLGRGMALVGYDVDPLSRQDAPVLQAVRQMGLACRTIASPRGPPAAGQFTDIDDALRRLILPGTLLLLRPDRVVMGLCRPAGLAMVLQRVQALMTEDAG